jgi:photosystem II stability/assembly factor-like uncharacterized protein
MTRRRAGLLLTAAALLALCGCGGGRPGTAGNASTAAAALTAAPRPSGTAAGAAGGTARTGCAGAPASPAAAGSAPAGVQFVSRSAGWAVLGQDAILATADGGQRWVTQYRTTARAGLSSVDFVDPAHGWVVGTSAVLATADGGRHWQALPEPCPRIRALHFLTPAVGFAVAGGSQPGPPVTGGVLLVTSDGGRTWRQQAAPPDVQSVCFTSPGLGWLGANGSIYGTRDGGQTWALAVRGPAGGPAQATVQCAGGGAAWAEVIGPGAAMSQEPHVGYHTSGSAWAPIFAEQYFPHPGVTVSAQAPGSYAGPFSAVSPAQAVFIDACTACGAGTAPMDLAADGGAVLQPRGNVGGITLAAAAAFVTPGTGWVVGTQTTLHPSGAATAVIRIMHTGDGGRTWQAQYTAGS